MDIYTVDVSTFGSRGSRAQHVTVHVLADNAEEALADAMRTFERCACPTINLLSEHASVTLAAVGMHDLPAPSAPAQHPDSIIRSGGDK